MSPLRATGRAANVERSDAIVIGSGVAGLAAALALAGRRVTLLTKTELGGGSSRWAQGGVAAAMAAEDSPRRHAADTLAAGAGLCEPEIVAELLAEGPGRLGRLIELGARFDRDREGRLLLGREAAHGRRRILHAGGDSTGVEMVRALVAALHRAPGIEVHERAFARDLVLSGGRVAGVLARHGNATVLHSAAVVILATGGFGQLYSRTTNPVEATGDGLAMAARAGAELADLAMVQFHPTALDTAADPLPLVTEALRGEGAALIDETGRRFLTEVDPRAELAPRDLVARALWRRQRGGSRVFLVPPPALARELRHRFPTVWASCRRAGIDPERQPIPVTPAAHYAMAGVAVDGRGRTSLPGLWACGELAASGLHGANRLASNSLLEALVLGARAAESAGGEIAPAASGSAGDGWFRREPVPVAAGAPAAVARSELRHLMWEQVGLVRSGPGLEAALARIEATGRHGASEELQNLLTVGRLVAAAALAREESRGAHFREDHPEPRTEFAHRAFWTYQAEAGPGEFPLSAVGAGTGRREIA